MPFTVKCQCGKVFNVKDEFQGRLVRCQICQTEFVALAEVPVQPHPPAASSAAPLTAAPQLSAAAPSSRACPYCAEQVPTASIICPFCRESLAESIDPAQGAQLLSSIAAQLDQYVQDSGNLAADAALRGGLLSMKTIVLSILLLLSIAMVFAGAMMPRDDGVALIVIGVILGLIFVITVIVSLVNDFAASHIGEAQVPSESFKRFFRACQTRRARKAFAALAPSARNCASVQQPAFEKIAHQLTKGAITDLDSFRAYWQILFRGPDYYARTVRLKKLMVEKATPDGVAVVHAEIVFGSYSKWLYLLIFLNIILCAIVIAVVTKRETKTVRKLLIRRGGRWYVAEGEFEGPLDKAAVGGMAALAAKLPVAATVV